MPDRCEETSRLFDTGQFGGIRKLGKPIALESERDTGLSF
jgi:hypothetical protein